MSRLFTNIYPIINLYKKMSVNSEIVSQMIYGESFSILKKTSKWIKIKMKEDNYKGYVQNKIFNVYIKPTHKICRLKASIYKFPNKKIKISELSFGSKIRVIKKKFKFFKFDKGWVSQNQIKDINYREKNIFKGIEIFKNVKYKWGGKSFKGIDCSALVQIFFNFNNKFCPRDAKDQFNFLKKNRKVKNIKKNCIVYWKGHVAVALSNSKLIHAYGPLKKTVVMGKNETIDRIARTANLNVIGVKFI